jgi:hypothetical protein
MLVQKRRNIDAALRLLRKLLKHQGRQPDIIVTDGLPSYRSAARELGCHHRHHLGVSDDPGRQAYRRPGYSGNNGGHDARAWYPTDADAAAHPQNFALLSKGMKLGPHSGRYLPRSITVVH